MSKREYRYAIIGGGVAAGYAIDQFIEQGVEAGDVCLISAEERPPYERPPLSKGILTGDEPFDEIYIVAPDHYEEHGIDLFLNTCVDSVDFARNTVHTKEDTYVYEKLLIVTGSHLRKLPIPGNDLDRLLYLRTADHAKQIRHTAKQSQNAVVLGGSFIGMEVASSLCQRGLSVTMVFPEERVWQSFFTPPMSRYFEDVYGRHGVTIVKGRSASQLHGQGEVEEIELDNGQRLPADLVVAGIGVEPNIELFADSDLQLDRGVLVNEYLETNLPGVFAAGDVAEFPDVVSGRRRRIEHWDNAYGQGAHAAKVMLGEHSPYDRLAYFFSDVFDLSYEFWGDTSESDNVAYRGDIETNSFSVWWLKKKQLVAAFVMGRPEEEREQAQKWIRSGEQLDFERLGESLGDLNAAKVTD